LPDPVRSELEQSGDVEKFTTRTDSAGRSQPATKPKTTAIHLPGDDGEKAFVEESKQIRAEKKPGQKKKQNGKPGFRPTYRNNPNGSH
jgi:hypothetical protein